jgi:hypothetical protein
MGSGFIVIGSLLAVGCGGGSHSSSLPLALSHPGPVLSASPSPNRGSATAIFSFLVPVPKRSNAVGSHHSPQYIPATVQSVQFKVLEVNGSPPVPTPTPASFTIPGSVCTLASGNYQCSLPVQMPVGNDLTQISTFDGSANLLSQQVGSPLAVVAGTANTFGTSLSPITLDAAPSTITAVGGSGVIGTQPNFTVNVSGTKTFTLSQVDAHGTAFGLQPGLPTLIHASATGAGASASISGSTLTLTPPTSAASTNVAVEADPAGTQDVTTTLTSSPDSGATSFTVSSTSGIYPGANLIVDYGTFGITTFLQESVLVTSVSGTTITVAPGLAHAHTSGASVLHYSDNLVSSADSFIVAINPILLVPIAGNGSNLKALVYDGTFTLQTGSLTIPTTSSYLVARLDSNDNLYIFNGQANGVTRSTYTPGTGFGSTTTYSGIPAETNGYFGFDVSSNGTVAVENFWNITPELTIFPAGTSSSPITFTSALGQYWVTSVYYIPHPTVAVLTDGSSNVFGYAYDVWYDFGTANDQIVVTNGSSEQDINNSSITSQFHTGFANPTLVWDQGRQSLIYANIDAVGGNYSILEFPRNGTTGASLQTSPTTIGNVTDVPQWVAASKDGSNVAVAWGAFPFTAVSIFHNNGSSWSLASGGSTLAGKTFYFSSMQFLSNGNLMILDFQNANFWQFTNVGTAVGSAYDLTGDFGSGYIPRNFAVAR